MNNSIITHFTRDQNTDYPAIVIYSLIGNDVCNGYDLQTQLFDIHLNTFLFMQESKHFR